MRNHGSTLGIHRQLCANISHRPSQNFKLPARCRTALSFHTSAPSFDNSTHPLTAAQVSRAAAQAVRHCCNTGELRSAFDIVNTLRHHLAHPKGQEPKLRPRLQKTVAGLDLSTFQHQVTPRLAFHALLHGLVKQGFALKASQLTNLMMQEGVHLRPRTLEALTSALMQTAHVDSSAHLPLPKSVREGHYRTAETLSLEKTMVENEHLAFGISLVQQARRSRQQRSDAMFKFLINMCILQGEIIAASLLFASLVKDWETRRNLAIQLGKAAYYPESLPPGQEDALAEWKFLRAESIYPRRAFMNSIARSIESNISPNNVDEDTLVSSLQALANLAVLLDLKSLPFPEIATLIRTMSRVPRSSHSVWIDRGNGPERVVAYAYIHEVLKHLINTLPAHRSATALLADGRSFTPRRLKDTSNHLLPALDLASYNSLLSYALRHRMSPALADNVLDHMRTKRYKSLHFDAVTYNILLRSGTLLRNSAIAQQALQAFRSRDENMNSPIMILNDSDDPRPPRPPPKTPSGSSRFGKAYNRSQVETITTNIAASAKSPVPLIADQYTLTAYITHLVSTGRPERVSQVLFHLLPELGIVDHPEWGLLDEKERAKLLRANREQCLKRSVSLGPFTFTVILNALRKAGKTGLAERVWLLAKRAEEASWRKGFVREYRPWCLPVEAYTTMIQCYAQEARRSVLPDKALKLERDLTHSVGWAPSEKQYVIGWARFILSSKSFRPGPLKRGDAGRTLGLLLFRSMLEAVREIFLTLMAIAKTEPISLGDTQIPKPDARFFNAALELFVRVGTPRARRKSIGPSSVRRKLMDIQQRHMRYDFLPKRWTPALQEICEAMVEAGYTVPPGLRYLFVGRWGDGCFPPERRVELLDRRPFAYPRPRPTFHPFSLATSKTRGLPLGRPRPRRPPIKGCSTM